MHVHAGLPWGLQPDHGHLHRKCILAANLNFQDGHVSNHGPVVLGEFLKLFRRFGQNLMCELFWERLPSGWFCSFFSPGICPFVTRFLLAETTAYEDRWCIPRDRKKRQALALQVMVNQLQRYSAILSLIRGSWGISCELEVDLQNHSCLWFQENFLALTTPRTGWRWWSRLMEGDRSQFMTWMADE